MIIFGNVSKKRSGGGFGTEYLGRVDWREPLKYCSTPQLLSLPSSSTQIARLLVFLVFFFRLSIVLQELSSTTMVSYFSQQSPLVLHIVSQYPLLPFSLIVSQQ